MRHLVVMARAPSSAGKTRLTAGMTPERAMQLREAILADTLTAARSAGVPVTIRVTPPEEVPTVAAAPWAVGVQVAAQTDGDLGRRMCAAFDAQFAGGANHVVLIGSDLPSLPGSRIGDAFRALSDGCDAVLGPAEDGGYYLIGLGRSRPELFEAIPWGGPDVRQRTVEAAARAGIGVALVEGWYDVDTFADLVRVIESTVAAPWTRAWFENRASDPGGGGRTRG